MQSYLSLSVGGFGIFWFMGAVFKSDFPGERSRLLRLLSLMCATFLFASGLPYVFSSFQSATPTELFGFVGRILGLMGCARVLHSVSVKNNQ